MVVTRERLADLHECYMYVFETFAVGASDVASQMGISRNSALSMLKRLEMMQLVGRVDVNEEAQGVFRRGEFKELTWQCWRTYDDYTSMQAHAHFVETVHELYPSLPVGA